jgi:hypothetical protein
MVQSAARTGLSLPLHHMHCQAPLDGTIALVQAPLGNPLEFVLNCSFCCLSTLKRPSLRHNPSEPDKKGGLKL